jgi:PAS domain S-box-containing protein
VAVRQPRQFQPEEIELLTTAGNAIGVAVENARLYEEQRQAAAELRVSERKYRTLFENANDAIWVHDVEGRFTSANKACEKLTGYLVEELLGKNVSELLSEESLSLARMVARKLLNGEPVEHGYEQRIIRKDGSEAIIAISTSLVTSQGQPTGFQNIARDVTEERELQDNLRSHLREILRAQEEERRRIARELHDDTAQSLLLMMRYLDKVALASQHKLPQPVEETLNQLYQLAKDTYDSMRRYAQDLRPRILDDFGLIAALEWMTEDLNRGWGIDAHVEVVGGKRTLSPETQLVLFRIAQESLSNIKKHAEASKAVIKLELDDRIRMSVIDDGKGFILPRRLSALANSGKLGLAGMEERAHLLGGTLNIQSEPGKGTAVIVDLPSFEE